MAKRKTKKHKLAFIGAGYVGLVSGTCLADIGHEVILVDIKQSTVNKLRRGNIHIYEPGLEHLVKKNIKAGRLSFTTSLKDAVKTSDVIFIAVQTPQGKDGHADLSYVKAAAKQIAHVSDSYKIVVNKSTVPPTTGDAVGKILQEHNHKQIDFDVVSNPEFLREGSAIQDFMKGDRHVIGTTNKRAEKVMREIYAPLSHMQLFVTDVKSAELIKYASNSFLATKISFINAVAQICELTGGNIDDVARGIGMDTRINPHFLKAGIGYGGSCFPKDVAAFIKIAHTHGYDFNLLEDVERINQNARKLLLKKIKHAVGRPKGKTIALWGLAFKPNTDDMREAPSITIAEELHKAGVKIQAYDPKARETAKAVIGNKVKYATGMYAALKAADALVIVTDWPEFTKPDWNKVQKLLKSPVIIDGRNMFEPAAMEKQGFVYHSVGRG